jgi:hypothetical protein
MEKELPLNRWKRKLGPTREGLKIEVKAARAISLKQRILEI